MNAANPPARSALLRAAGVAAPAAIPAGTANVVHLELAEAYARDVKRRRSDPAPTATPADSAAAFLYRVETAVDQSFGLQAAIAAAVGPAIGPAVAAAVGPAVAAAIAPLSARMDNLPIRIRNSNLLTAQHAIRPTIKENAHHAATQPVDPGLAALPVPVPVGTALPPLAFFPAAGLTRQGIHELTHANINDLEWFYNVRFGPPAPIAARRDAILVYFAV
ncbi:hypothetical protein HK097_009310 [Rhizophlyctis rosea]|uniref:Uncharacterized protein n=1 Tax=Rhizophlyctis rosea TaxID=64517 RepID=A0AAD5X3C4_9FUNG|nr:hypothetical protein HK097_009310 [Rhizophlyctis rosea]